MKVTKIEPQKNSASRVSIFVDDKYQGKGYGRKIIDVKYSGEECYFNGIMGEKIVEQVEENIFLVQGMNERQEIVVQARMEFDR